MMIIKLEDDCVGILPDHPFSKRFTVYGYEDGTFSFIPHNFFVTWMGEEPQLGSFHLGRCSGIGVGSTAKYDAYAKLTVGRYVSGGSHLRFILNSRHEIRSISTSCLLSWTNGSINHPVAPQLKNDTVIGNDVWIGDESLILGGSIIESGCVIGSRSVVPANFRSEPYGIYAGAPARLLRFRFPEAIREKLLELAWWYMPQSWIKANNDAFMVDLTADEGRALEILAELVRRKRHCSGQRSPDVRDYIEPAELCSPTLLG